MTPNDILHGIHERASVAFNKSVIENQIISDKVDYICRCMSNRSGVRLLMSTRSLQKNA